MSDAQAAVKRSASKAEGDERHEAIYRAVSDAIVEQRLKPGARLREDALPRYSASAAPAFARYCSGWRWNSWSP